MTNRIFYLSVAIPFLSFFIGAGFPWVGLTVFMLFGVFAELSAKVGK